MIDYSKLFSQVALRLPDEANLFSAVAPHPDLISLGVGEPDFATPWHIRQAGIESLERGRTWYTLGAGLDALRAEICAYLERRFALKYDADKQTLITVGGSEGIDIVARAVVNPGDEVIIPEPCYVSYRPVVEMCGGVVVPVATKAENGFRLTAGELRAAITPKTKLLVFPFPSNPTGAVMRKEHLLEIAQVLEGTDILVMSDEIYAELTYEGKHVSIASISEDMYARTIIISGFSKAYAMTGWRLGYICGPEPLVHKMDLIHQYAIMCAPTTSQYAGAVAMRDGDESVAEMVSSYNMRRRLMVSELAKIDMPCFEPEGAFYVFPNITKSGLSSAEFAQRLFEEEHLLVIPGTSFGASGEGYVRISYSYSVQHLTQALVRLERFMRKCKAEQ